MSHHNPSPLERLSSLDPSSPDFPDQVSNIFYGAEYKQWVKGLQDNEASELIECLDELLDHLDSDGPGFRRCLREIRHLSGARMILPKSCLLSSRVLQIGPRPVASGGSGDVYEGKLDNARVCVKRVRMYVQEGPQAATKTLYKEAVVWKRLVHENIVPFLGITTSPLQLISEWMSHGDLPDYIEKYPDTNRLGLVCDIAEGLCYLHSHSVVHGDLKGPNILVDISGRARITDFGLATVTQNLDSVRSISDDHGHTARWTAPEILSEDGSYSKEGDVFSFAMVMIEIYTGAVPFSPSLPAAAMLAIMNGKRPQRPTHPTFTEDLWALMQHCWEQDFSSRPEISEALRGFRKIKPPLGPFPAETSSSTLSPEREAQLSGPPKAAARRPPPLHDAIAAASRHNPPFSSQPSSDDSSPISPVNYIGFGRMTESSTTRTRESSHTTSPDSPHGTDTLRSDQRGAQKNGLVLQTISRVDTTMTEPSPMPTDPQPFNFDELQRNPANQVYDQMGGHGGSRSNPQNAVGDIGETEGGMVDETSHVDPSHEAGGNNAGKAWPEGQSTPGGPRSLVAVGFGNTPGAPGWSSRPDLLRHQSQDRVPQYRQSEASLSNIGKNLSNPDPTIVGDATPMRRPSGKDTPDPNGPATRNISDLDLATEVKTHNQSHPIADEALPENLGPSTLQTQEGLQLLHNAIVTASHHVPHISSSPSSANNSSITAVSRIGSVEADESQRIKLGESPQIMMQDPSHEGKPSGYIACQLSRKDTTASEPSPMPVDPQPLNFDELRRGGMNRPEASRRTTASHIQTKVTSAPGPSVRPSIEKLSSTPALPPAVNPDNESTSMEDSQSGTQNSKPSAVIRDSKLGETPGDHSPGSDHPSAPQDISVPIAVPLQLKAKEEQIDELPPKRGFFRRLFCCF